MYSKIIILLSVLISFPVLSQENDFDKFCSYFDKLNKTLVNENMTKPQKAAFINKLVTHNLEKNSHARKIWEVIIYAVPDERYEMVQSTANELLKINWQCESMKKHIPTTGN